MDPLVIMVCMMVSLLRVLGTRSLVLTDPTSVKKTIMWGPEGYPLGIPGLHPQLILCMPHMIPVIMVCALPLRTRMY